MFKRNDLHFGILVMCISSVAALKCYECNSHKNEKCKSAPTSDLLKECAPDPGCTKPCTVACRKISQTVENAAGLKNDHRIVRQCARKTPDHTGCRNSNGLAIIREICYCNTDGCNHTVQQSPRLSLVLLSVIGAVMLNKVNY